jgi:hypothetical protein
MDAREHRSQLGQAAAEQLTQYLHTLSADEEKRGTDLFIFARARTTVSPNKKMEADG